MSKSTLTEEEMVNSLTGFDEIAISQSMGLDVYLDTKTKPIGIMRALVFVAERRSGLSDSDARAVAMGASLADVQAYFAESDDADDPDEPVGDVGKDSPPPSGLPAS